MSVRWGGQNKCQEVKPELSLVWVGKGNIRIYICILFYSL